MPIDVQVKLEVRMRVFRRGWWQEGGFLIVGLVRSGIEGGCNVRSWNRRTPIVFAAAAAAAVNRARSKRRRRCRTPEHWGGDIGP